MTNVLRLLDNPLILLLAVLVVILGVGRLSRVVTYDAFPPAAWLRDSWNMLLIGTRFEGWAKLITCPWCFTPWLMLVAIVWFMLAGGWVLVAWWIFWGWLGLAYVASMVIARDEPAE